MNQIAGETMTRKTFRKLLQTSTNRSRVDINHVMDRITDRDLERFTMFSKSGNIDGAMKLLNNVIKRKI